jgi:hypothetical protein
MRITKGLIWLILAAGILFGGAILANRMGYLPASVQKGGAYETYFEVALRLVATVLIGPPVVFLIVSLFSAGSDKVSEDRDGLTVLRLRTGARVFGVLLGWALAALFFLGPYYDGGILLSLILAPFGLFFFVGGLWCLIAVVKYDRHKVFATDYLFRLRRYNWSDLLDVIYVPEAYEYHLLFQGGSKARVSTFYAGAGELIRFAQSKVRHA